MSRDDVETGWPSEIEMAKEVVWAVRHEGGCHGNRPWTLRPNRTMAEILMRKCTDPSCKLVRVEVREVEVIL
jgi:hypothetical protein